MLPFVSLERNSFKGYLKVVATFLEFCYDRQYACSRPDWKVIAAFLLHLFRLRRCTRSNSGIVSKIRWYYATVRNSGWLSEGASRLLDLSRKSLRKLAFSAIKKSRPLALWMLEAMVDFNLISSARDRALLAAWACAHALMCRPGELLSPKRLVRSVQFIRRPPVFVFHHSFIRPKANKERNAPYSSISQQANPFAFACLLLHFREFHPNPTSSSSSYPLFPAFRRGRPVLRQASTPATAVLWLQQKLRLLGVPRPSLYTGHSGRRGGFNHYRRSVPLDQIAIQGHWAPQALTAVKEYRHLTLLDRSAHF